MVVRNHFTIAERLAALDQPWNPSGRLTLRFIATPPMCGHRVTAERIGLAANSAPD
jgi:hypothetical protein